MYKITKSWLGIERKAINKAEETTLKMSNEIIFDNDCNAENIASCFDFIRSCLNFQEIVEGIYKTDSSEIKTEKYQIENGNNKQVIEKPLSEVEKIIQDKENKIENKANNNSNTNNQSIVSAFDW